MLNSQSRKSPHGSNHQPPTPPPPPPPSSSPLKTRMEAQSQASLIASMSTFMAQEQQYEAGRLQNKQSEQEATTRRQTILDKEEQAHSNTVDTPHQQNQSQQRQETARPQMQSPSKLWTTLTN
ncbi:hypothetical protein BC826DRAFT_1021142 [Russula brevipes]|nr:hypothetical protein BC826DRAFT_1021142 [Russula brevipes]